MLELGVGADIVRGIGWLFIGLMVAAIAAALWIPKSRLGKAIATVGVLGGIGAIYVPSFVQQYEYKQRYAKAKALFDERCKTAGEKIYRTVEGVEGIFLMRLRVASEAGWFNDQYTAYDIFAGDDGGSGSTGSRTENYSKHKPPPDTYILSLLRPVIVDPPIKDSPDPFSAGKYLFVELEDPADGQIYRYTASYFSVNRITPKTQPWVRDIRLDRVPIQKRTARYGISWEDETRPGDREFWIAGSSVRVVDLESNQVIAQRTGFVMDPKLGNTAGFRSPWGFSLPCGNYAPQQRKTSYFVERVLNPSTKENP
ncbi:hypothetical protein [Hydrogenophaga sp.]|uniref:hypothetical protein n=1 Tax=Hydrogenophaga sp. TaxID=1904254 RepID=UPI0026222E4D|nr:hypothetical protein [Hydrogenophaga sp.]MCW5655752.1 hypothetical protein [Hydrogenophaga sp.]